MEEEIWFLNASGNNIPYWYDLCCTDTHRAAPIMNSKDLGYDTIRGIIGPVDLTSLALREKKRKKDREIEIQKPKPSYYDYITKFTFQTTSLWLINLKWPWISMRDLPNLQTT